MGAGAGGGARGRARGGRNGTRRPGHGRRAGEGAGRARQGRVNDEGRQRISAFQRAAQRNWV